MDDNQRSGRSSFGRLGLEKLSLEQCRLLRHARGACPCTNLRRLPTVVSKTMVWSALVLRARLQDGLFPFRHAFRTGWQRLIRQFYLVTGTSHSNWPGSRPMAALQVVRLAGAP